MTHYGLPTSRDNDGNRKPIEHTYEWQGQSVTVKLLPPTAGEAEEYENLGEDISPTDMADIVGKHIIKPEFDDPAEMTLPELRCYAEGIFAAVEAENDFAEQVNEEIESRGGEPGNSMP